MPVKPTTSREKKQEEPERQAPTPMLAVAAPIALQQPDSPSNPIQASHDIQQFMGEFMQQM
ncbi:MAG: hypothetical protein ACK53L_24745, partial [Pirellulaceae bacterium]